MKHVRTNDIYECVRGLAAGGGSDTILPMLERLNAYLSIENRILTEKLLKATGQKAIHFTADQKRSLSMAAHGLHPALLAQAEKTFSPKTIFAWYRALVGDKYNSVGQGQHKRGRKPVDDALRDLIVRMARENPSWGYKRIARELVQLGYDVTFMTVKRVLDNYGIVPPGQRRSEHRWEQFVETHKDVIVSCDFTTYELVTPSGLERHHILFFEDIATRRVWCGGIRHNPDGKWMKGVARNQCDMLEGPLLGKKYLLHDNDPLFQGALPDYLATIGCKDVRTPQHMPNCNAHIESFIKTFKTECLDHLILTDERQLQYVVREFLEYYNHERCHSGLDGRRIDPRPEPPDGELRLFTRLGGLLKCYRRVVSGTPGGIPVDESPPLPMSA